MSRLTDVADVTVNLLDLNDNKPQFTESSYEINIPENQLAGEQIGKVRPKYFSEKSMVLT